MYRIYKSFKGKLGGGPALLCVLSSGSENIAAAFWNNTVKKEDSSIYKGGLAGRYFFYGSRYLGSVPQQRDRSFAGSERTAFVVDRRGIYLPP